MTKPVKQTFLHKLILWIKSFKIDWRRWLCPIIIDRSVMTKADIINAWHFNVIIWIAFAAMAVMVEIWTYPHWGRMLGALFIVLCIFLGFCSLSNSIRKMKSPAGRKEKKKISGFAECFVKEEYYQRVNQYILNSFSTSSRMKSGQAIALIMIINETGMSNEGEAPLATFLIEEYGPMGILNFDTARTVTGAKRDEKRRRASSLS